MTVFVVPIGPEVPLQLPPATPVIDQETVPVGVAPDVGPATVAVNTKVEPSTEVDALVVIVTVGVTFATSIPYGVLGPAVR